MTKVLRSDVQSFITALKADPARAVAIAQTEIDRLTGSLSAGSLKTYLSLRRSAVLQELGANHPAYDMLRLSDAQYEQLRQGYQAAVSQRQADPVRIRNATGMIATGAALLASQNPYDIVLGLCLVTGRRPVEITSNPDTRLDPVVISTDRGKITESYAVRFRGQAKTRGADDSLHNKVNTIPTLDRAPIVIAAFQRLRHMKPTWVAMPEASYKSFLVILNRRCKAIFAPFWPAPAGTVWTEGGRRSRTAETDLPERTHTGRGKVKTDTHTISARDLRAIYAEACSRIVNKTGTPTEQMKPAEFVARILGHSQNDLTTAQSYGAYVLDLDTNPTIAGKNLQTAITQAHAKAAAERDAREQDEDRDDDDETRNAGDDQDGRGRLAQGDGDGEEE
jgi:hypothetical protein